MSVPGNSSRMFVSVVVVLVLVSSLFAGVYVLPWLLSMTDHDVTADDPILIVSDADFAHQAAERNWIGFGTQESPFVISGLRIESDTACIRIENVTVYFVIRDCILYTPKSAYYGICVDVRNSSNGVVEYCNVTGRETGVAFLMSRCMTVRHCGISSVVYGVNATICENISVIDCTVALCWWSVALVGANSSRILNNTLDQNEVGVSSQFSRDCTISGNVFSDNIRAVQVGLDCLDWDIVDNDVLNSADIGIVLDSLSQGIRVIGNRIGWSTVCNALDDGVENSWDDGESIGNSWSDYSGTGVYYVNGTATSIDHFPSILT